MSDFLYVAIVFSLMALAFAIGFALTHLPAAMRRAVGAWYRILNVIGGRNNAE